MVATELVLCASRILLSGSINALSSSRPVLGDEKVKLNVSGADAPEVCTNSLSTALGLDAGVCCKFVSCSVVMLSGAALPVLFGIQVMVLPSLDKATSPSCFLYCAEPFARDSDIESF